MRVCPTRTAATTWIRTAFAAEMKEYAAIGVSMVGGCCGTTPAFIAKLHETFRPLAPADKIPIRRSCLCTPVRFVEVNGITVVGERINPTGKSACSRPYVTATVLTPALQAVAQAEAGAQVLDVNAGLPGIDEAATLEQLVKDLQAVTDLPLQLDSSNPRLFSRALRAFITASPSSTRSTARLRRWKRFCRSVKVRCCRRRPGAG